MNVVIAYEIESADRAILLERKIETFPRWVAISPTAYLIVADEDMAALIESLQQFIGPQDQIWAFEPTARWAGYGNPIVDDHVVSILGDGVDWVPTDWPERAQ